MNKLPDEILRKILNNLHLNDLKIINIVNKQINLLNYTHNLVPYYIFNKLYGNEEYYDNFNDCISDLKDLKDNYNYTQLEYLKDLAEIINKDSCIYYSKNVEYKRVIPFQYNLDIKKYNMIEKNLEYRRIHKVYNISLANYRKIKKNNYQVLALL